MRKSETKIALAFAAITVLSITAEYAYRIHLANREYAPPPDGMIVIPAGTYVTGTNDPNAGPDERPKRRVFLPAFYIDQYEVTNAQYKAFDPTHTFSEGKETHPVTGKHLHEARAYAESIGKRLPTLYEWEKAARGTTAQDYPWGHTFEDNRANINGQPGLQPVGTHPEGASPYGVHDMVGNAWEWVDTKRIDGGPLTGVDPIERHIIKGGAYSYSPYHARISHHGYEAPGTTCNDVGFRCVKEINEHRN